MTGQPQQVGQAASDAMQTAAAGSSRFRVPYAVAGAAGRDVLQLAASLSGSDRLNATEWRVLAAVVAHTALFSRLEDKLAHRTIAEWIGLELTAANGRRVKRALRRLADLGLVSYRPGESTPAVGRRSSTVGLIAGQGARPDPGSDEHPGNDGLATGGMTRPGQGARPDPPSEKYSEKRSEDAVDQPATGPAAAGASTPGAAMATHDRYGDPQADGASADDGNPRPPSPGKLRFQADGYRRHGRQPEADELDAEADRLEAQTQPAAVS